MKTVHFQSVAIAGALLMSIADTIAAQETRGAVLNSLEVQQLVAWAEPADNVRLSAHFSALADRYADQAKSIGPCLRASSVIRAAIWESA